MGFILLVKQVVLLVRSFNIYFPYTTTLKCEEQDNYCECNEDKNGARISFSIVSAVRSVGRYN